MIQETAKYEEWLTTIANTRLIYNTMDELEYMLDNHSIHNNGIRRCFITPQRMRSTFRDLKVEVELMTDGTINLNNLLIQYQQAWTFYHDNLYRRINLKQIAQEILTYTYPPFKSKGITAKKTAIYQQIKNQHLNIPLLILLLMKAIPGYDSKGGDVFDMPLQFDRIISLLNDFVENECPFSLQPVIAMAKEEPNKSRLMLIYHVCRILDTYKSYTAPDNLYYVANNLKEERINLDIVGFWNECGGDLLNTEFWQIEDALEYGTYFMTHWHKDADNRLTSIRYTLFLNESTDGRIFYYILHPKAIKHRMKGLKYTEADQVFYQTEMLDGKPSELPLYRLLFSTIWPQKIHLTRCTKSEVLSQYENWLYHECEIIKPFQHLEYEFHPNIYAITQTHLYIPTSEEHEYYKIPLSAYEGFEHIKITDNAGIMTMNGKSYLAIDEFLLYIPITKKELQKYHIERVNSIE